MKPQIRQCLTGGHNGKPKSAFRTQDEADQWLYATKLHAVMTSYWCRHCYNYHVGHAREKRAE